MVKLVIEVNAPEHPAVHPGLVVPLPLILDLGAIPRGGGGDGAGRASTASTDSCLSNLTVGCVLPKKYQYSQIRGRKQDSLCQFISFHEKAETYF